MADAPSTSAPARRRVNPILILVVVGGGALAYITWKRNKAAQAAAAAASTNQGATTAALTPTPAGTYDPNADTSALLGYLTGLAGPGSVPASSGTTTTGTPTTSPQFTQVQGNGDAGNQLLDVVGSIVQPSTYQGFNVAGGAPVYANIGGQWKIGVPAAQIPVGTALATPVANQGQINVTGGTVTEQLG